VASDADWTHGSGPEVPGPILPLVQARTVRAIAVSDLSGDGVPTLMARMPPRAEPVAKRQGTGAS
jgi:hypothetical protein